MFVYIHIVQNLKYVIIVIALKLSLNFLTNCTLVIHVTIVLGEIFHICEVSTRSYELLKPVPSTTIIREGTYFVASLMSIYTRYNMCI